MILILMGAPGAGKGTQADLLSERHGFVKVSTGDALRRQIKLNSEIGQKASFYMSEGKLVPDEILVRILETELNDIRDKKILLDGYPRNIEQAKTLMDLSESMDIRGAIHIDVAEEQLVKRLSGRRVCSQCGASYHTSFSPTRKDGICDRCSGELVQRPDDREEKVRVRLNIYDETTKPVLDFYKKQGLYNQVDGNGSTEEVYQKLERVIQSVL